MSFPAVPDGEAAIIALLRRDGTEAGLRRQAAVGHAALHALVEDRIATELEAYDEPGDDGEIRYKNLQPSVTIDVAGEGRDPELPLWSYLVTVTCLGGTVDGAEGSEMEPNKPAAVYRALSEVFRWGAENVRTDYGLILDATEESVEVTDEDLMLGWPFKKAAWRVQIRPV